MKKFAGFQNGVEGTRPRQHKPPFFQKGRCVSLYTHKIMSRCDSMTVFRRKALEGFVMKSPSIPLLEKGGGKL